jgi:N-acetylmuramoyl-L-alanine amidase
VGAATINIAVKIEEDLIMEPVPATIGFAPADGKRKPRGLFKTAARSAAAVGFLLFVSGCATQHPVTVKDTSRTFTTVVIDPGHGGKDSGTWSRGRRGPVILEKVVALDVAQRLNEKLKAAGFHTVMTRQTDIFIPLEDRARISNAQTNAIYVSIHFNDSPKRKIHGIETYYHSDASLAIAEKIERNLDSMPGESDRGVKYADFHVLRKNQYPAVLVECGFLSNKTEAVRAASPDYRQHLADKIADAIYEQRYGNGTTPQAVVAKAPGAQQAPPPEAGL